jgi:hypothetical protein
LPRMTHALPNALSIEGDQKTTPLTMTRAQTPQVATRRKEYSRGDADNGEDDAGDAALADAGVKQSEGCAIDEFEQDGIAGDDPDGMTNADDGTDGHGDREQGDEERDSPLDCLEERQAEEDIEEHLEDQGPGVAHDVAVAGVVK